MDRASSDSLAAAGRWECRGSWQRISEGEGESRRQRDRHRKKETQRKRKIEAEREGLREKLMMQNFHECGARVARTRAPPKG